MLFNKKKEAPMQQDEDMGIDFGTPVENQSDDMDLDFDFDDDESQPYQAEESVYTEPEPTYEEQTYEEQTYEEPTYKEEPQQIYEEQQIYQEPQQTYQEPKQNTDKSDQLQDIVLHFIVDRSPSDMLDYFRGYGVNVSKIFNDIEDAKNEILMQINPCRIVVVDSGTGRFSIMSARKSLIDLLGIGDEDNKISVFYTDQVIKDDVSIADEVDNKQIDWIKYRSTADILATLLQKKKSENYILDETLGEDAVRTKPEELMSFKGLTSQAETLDLGLPSITPDEIFMHREEGPGFSALKAYEVKY